MTRPAEQSALVIRTWATNANHPAGAEVWHSQPTKVEPPGPAGGFYPGQGAAAEYLNKLFYDAFTQESAIALQMVTKGNELLNFVGQMPVLNFPVVAGSIGDLKAAVFDPTNLTWYAVGNVENVRASDDMGLTWSSASLVDTVGSNEDCTQVDVDQSGNVVVATATRYVFELTRPSTWTRVDVHGASVFPNCCIAYDPINAKWIWVGVMTGPGTATSRSSTDRVTWSASVSVPTSTTASGAIRTLTCRKDTGRTIFATCDGTTGAITSTDDGGTTWTARANITFGFTPEYVHLTHSSGNTWLLTAGKESGLNYDSEVWYSANNGVTFTKIATLADTVIKKIAAYGSMLVASASITSGGTVYAACVFSLDGGATWYASQHHKGSSVGAYAGGGGILMLGTIYAYHSLRAGLPTWAALT
jgi:hypothetical protein